MSGCIFFKIREHFIIIFAVIVCAGFLLFPVHNSHADIYTFKNPKTGDVVITSNPQRVPKGYKLISREGLYKKNSKAVVAKTSNLNIRPRTSQYDDMIVRISREYKVDPSLVKAIIHVESAFNSRAVSPKGAQGLMQLMPGTASRFGVTNSFNTEQNIRGGVKYIKTLMKQFNFNLRYVLAAYNAGEQNVIKYRGIPPFPETIDYVDKVTRLHYKYRQS